jgi:hypothetical protein
MTTRVLARAPKATPDFTALTNAEAARRVQQLVKLGYPEHHVLAFFGWGVTDVRRALARRPDSPGGLEREQP